MKAIHRQIVLSSTYRQTSRQTARHGDADPDNRWLSRGPRNRLPAELIRDNALAISGQLVETMKGPPVYPPQPPGLWHQTGRNEPVYSNATDADRFRRGVYVVWRRAAPYPSFTNFDAPDRMTCVAQRPNTNTPLQALTLLNDEVYMEVAKAMAARVLNDTASQSLPSQLEYAFHAGGLPRAPVQRELQLLEKLYQDELSAIQAEGDRLTDLLDGIEVARLKIPADRQRWAAWTMVCNAILNLDEVITK